MDVAYPAPFYWDAEKAKNDPDKWHLESDTCVILETESCFIRGVLEIPVIGSKDVFVWGIWITLSKENFKRYLELFKAEDVSEEKPYFGWFASKLKGYPDTLNIKTHAHLQNNGMRPKIELDHENQHPLCQEQHTGITMERVHEILKINEII